MYVQYVPSRRTADSARMNLELSSAYPEIVLNSYHYLLIHVYVNIHIYTYIHFSHLVVCEVWGKLLRMIVFTFCKIVKIIYICMYVCMYVCMYCIIYEYLG